MACDTTAGVRPLKNLRFLSAITHDVPVVLRDVAVTTGAEQFSVATAIRSPADVEPNRCIAGITTGDVVISVDGEHGEAFNLAIRLPRGMFPP